MSSSKLATLAALVFLLIAGCDSSVQVFEEPRCTVLLHFNDFHGHLFPSRSSPGAARLKTAIDEERQRALRAGCEPFLLVAGDAIQGTAVSLLFRGKSEFELLKLLRVDAIAVGNHEFDYGLARLLNLASEAGLKLISANVVYSDTQEPVFPPYTVLWTHDGLRIGVLGLTTPQTRITTAKGNVEGLDFLPPEQVLTMYLPVLADETDFVVILSHLGDPDDYKLTTWIKTHGYSRIIAGILGGHTHRLIVPTAPKVHSFVAQAFEYGKALGVLKLEFATGMPLLTKAFAVAVSKDLPEDPTVKEFVLKVRKDSAAIAEKVVGRLAAPLSYNAETHYKGSSPIGSFVADVLKEAAHADVAFINSGAIRAGLPAGNVRYADLLECLPFPNRIVVLDLKGEDLLSILAKSWRHALGKEPSRGGFLQVSGVRIETVGSKIVYVEAAGAPLDTERTYQAATISFLANGGDGYRQLFGVPRTDIGTTLYEAMLWALSQESTVPPPQEWERWIPKNKTSLNRAQQATP